MKKWLISLLIVAVGMATIFVAVLYLEVFGGGMIPNPDAFGPAHAAEKVHAARASLVAFAGTMVSALGALRLFGCLVIDVTRSIRSGRKPHPPRPDWADALDRPG